MNASNTQEKVHYKVWERSNRLSLMLTRMIIVDNIKTIIHVGSIGKCTKLFQVVK